MAKVKFGLTPRYSTAALEASGIDLSSASDQAWFDIPMKCQVVYAGCTVTTVVAGAAVVKFDRQNAAQSATGRTDGTIAAITLPDTTAIGTMVYDKACQGSMSEATAAGYTTAATCRAAGGYWNTNTSKCENHPYGELQPGNQVVVEVVSGTTGNVVPILVVEADEDVFANLQNVLETA